MNARSILAVAVVVAAVLLTSGCGTAIGEGVALIKGGQGSCFPTSPRYADPDLLVGYTNFQIGAMNDETGTVPAGFFDYASAQLQADLTDAGLGFAAGRTCVIEGDVVHFETEGLSAILLGPLEEIVVKARLVDADTGKVLARARCVGRIDARLTKGADKVAEGLGKAFAAWIEANHPVSAQ